MAVEHLAHNTMDVIAEGSGGYPGRPLCLFPLFPTSRSSTLPLGPVLLLSGHTCLKAATLEITLCTHPQRKLEIGDETIYAGVTSPVLQAQSASQVFCPTR